MAWWRRIRNSIRKRRRLNRKHGTGEETGTAGRRPSRLTDASVALLLAVADAFALAGVALLMFLVGMSHSEPSVGRPTSGQHVSFLLLALVWVIPGALALSSYVHARLRMPITSVVQGLFFIVGTTLAIGEMNMLLSLG
ncbi:hypothetical protein OG252_03810 [Streptomyces sp. NBC_01352]|uniref:hypothetical protein n=1 Tax=Streptomyces sp. NBC_01352 TaxID=2903834 RepID=UPI002E2FEAC3|nr:hypothetical protein [Streptomyces sp. NBC_01352]